AIDANRYVRLVRASTPRSNEPRARSGDRRDEGARLGCSDRPPARPRSVRWLGRDCDCRRPKRRRRASRGVVCAGGSCRARLGAERLVYVSCDPETLARDLDHLSRLGYGASALHPVDMIPLTDEVETVAVLGRCQPVRPRVHWEDEDVLVVDKSPHEPTIPQGEYQSSLLDRVRAIAPDAAPVHRLDVGTSGLVIFGKSRGRVSAWQAALGAE